MKPTGFELGLVQMLQVGLQTYSHFPPHLKFVPTHEVVIAPIPNLGFLTPVSPSHALDVVEYIIAHDMRKTSLWTLLHQRLNFFSLSTHPLDHLPIQWRVSLLGLSWVLEGTNTRLARDNMKNKKWKIVKSNCNIANNCPWDVINTNISKRCVLYWYIWGLGGLPMLSISQYYINWKKCIFLFFWNSFLLSCNIDWLASPIH